MKEAKVRITLTVRWHGKYCESGDENDEGLRCDGFCYNPEMEAYCAAHPEGLLEVSGEQYLRNGTCRKKHA